MSIPQLRLEELYKKEKDGILEKSTLVQVTDMYHDLEHPHESSLLEPTGIISKGRPKGSTKYSTKRASSLFEHRRDELEEFEKEKEIKKEKEMENENGTQGTQGSQGRGRVPPRKDKSEAPGSQFPDQPITYMGVNFGVRNVDYFWFPYIKEAKDVIPDMYCGYQSLAVLLGYEEHYYPMVRMHLAAELLDNRDVYMEILPRLAPGMSYEDLIFWVNYVISPCSSQYWLDMPLIGLVFATAYQVALCFLSWDGPCFCLPMKARNTSLGPRTKILMMAHVGARNHFIPVWLKDDCPVPPPLYAWRCFKDRSVDGWDFQFQSRFQIFRDYRIRCNRPPDPLV